jgi:hypothetical protein
VKTPQDASVDDRLEACQEILRVLAQQARLSADDVVRARARRQNRSLSPSIAPTRVENAIRRVLGCALLLAVVLAFPGVADARKYAPLGTRPGEVYGFGTSQCKSAYCFSKHPEGYWRHPLTVPYGKPRRAY